MPEPDMPAATTSGEEATASAASGEHKPEVFGISPAVGPVPAIYVPQSPSEPSATGLFWYAEAQAARRARSWAAFHPPPPHPECPAHPAAAPPCPPAP